MNKAIFPLLSLDLQRYVFEFDSTFHTHFKTKVLPEVMEMAWKRIVVRFFTYESLTEMYEMLSEFDENDLVNEEDDDDDDSGIEEYTFL